ncbi:nitroreductase/quinone reductase family protein [Amycolatopsis sp. NPDC005232]|uniref:nitroreductase/quinone reductase family protein n=1 Tax=Amycolatopsis sp. NPDC005232 TaxID=3157027 RepID=UPI0033ACCA05
MGEAIELSDLNQRVITEFRANGGIVRGEITVKHEAKQSVLNFEGEHLALVHHVGAKSGRHYISPLGCLEVDGRVFVFASFGGSELNPSWYHNLLVNPEVKVEIGTEIFDAVATEIKGRERDEIYSKQVEASPVFGDYQRVTKRLIPVIELVRSPIRTNA